MLCSGTLKWKRRYDHAMPRPCGPYHRPVDASHATRGLGRLLPTLLARSAGSKTMSPSQIYEPTYRAMKQFLMAGHWPAGMRLEAARIAADLQVSPSPVRDCLHRLAGERMIDARTREGFHVPQIHAQTLRDLLGSNLALLLAALAGAQSCPAPEEVRVPADHATRTARTFHRIANLSGNAELVMLIDGLSDRMHCLRRLEEGVLAHPANELDLIDLKLSQPKSAPELRNVLRAYHRRRHRAASRLAHMLPAI